MAKKNIKLVLSGSGTRYPCFIGAIQRLIEEGYEIEEVCGTSGGAIIAAGLAAFYDKENPLKTVIELQKIALQILPKDNLDPHFLNIVWGTNGIFKGKKMLKQMRKILPESFSETKIPVNIVTFNNNTGTHKFWNAEDNISLPLAVRASMSLPFIFDPIKIKGDKHTDGGITANFPIDIFGTGENVVGLAFISKEPKKRREINNKIDMIQANLNGAIQNSMRESLEDVKSNAKYMPILTEHPGLDLFMTEQDVLSQISDGYHSIDRWL